MEAPKGEGRIIFCSLRGPLERLRDVCIGEAPQMVSKRPGLANHSRNNKGKWEPECALSPHGPTAAPTSLFMRSLALEEFSFIPSTCPSLTDEGARHGQINPRLRNWKLQEIRGPRTPHFTSLLSEIFAHLLLYTENPMPVLEPETDSFWKQQKALLTKVLPHFSSRQGTSGELLGYTKNRKYWA